MDLDDVMRANASDRTAPRRPHVPWYLTKWALLAFLLAALGVGMCDPLWAAMPWSGR
jgi:hypothetical protein